MKNEQTQASLNVDSLDRLLNESNLKTVTGTLSRGSLPVRQTTINFNQHRDNFRVISNKFNPISYNPVPKTQFQDTLYVVALGSAGFTAQRIKSDNRQERLNQIHRAWNIQVLKDFWSHLVAHPLPEEEFFAEFGFIIACRKFVIETAGESREVWDTKIWKVTNGKIEAHQQFISKQEPVPMTIRNSAGLEERVFLLNKDEALHFNPEINDIELIKVSAESIIGTTNF